MAEYDVAVIGGGIAGLNAAYRLCQKGKKVILIEKDNNLGGMLQSFKINDLYIEKFYHHVFRENKLTISLIRELGLTMTWNSASTAFNYKNKFYGLTVPSDLLWFKPLSFTEKLRLGFFLFKIKLIKNPKPLDNISAEEYILKNSGEGVYRKFLRPLLSAKYGKNLKKISAAWFAERINLRNKRGYKGEILGYIEGGFELLIKTLSKEIKSLGGEIILGKAVTKMNISKEKVQSISLGNKKITADFFISTVSSSILEKISAFPAEYSQMLHSLENQGAICILAGIKKKISKFYWTNIINEDLHFRALIEHTNFQLPSKYRENIIYLASYPNLSSNLWNLSDSEIFKIYFKDLQKMADLRLEDINWYKIVKEKEAGLIYDKGILKKLPSATTPFSNLFLAGMLNSYPDRNLEESINVSNRAVNLILKNENRINPAKL